MGNGRFLCRGCRHQQSVTAGTVFQGSHLALPAWFRAMWYVCANKNGMSAQNLQRLLGLPSYNTAWLCLHKLRRAMVRPGRECLSGVVEADETYVGGPREGKRGRGAFGKQIVFIAAEVRGRKIGRIRLSSIPDVSGATLVSAVSQAVAAGAPLCGRMGGGDTTASRTRGTGMRWRWRTTMNLRKSSCPSAILSSV